MTAAPHSRRRRRISPWLLGLVLVVGNPADALAYVDPGAGSYLFQMAAAGLLAAVYTLRGYVQALMSTIRGRVPPWGAHRPNSRL